MLNAGICGNARRRIVVGIAFPFAGSSVFIGGLRQLGGGGATVSWPAIQAGA